MSLILQALQRARREMTGEDPSLAGSRIHHPQRVEKPPQRRGSVGLVAGIVMTSSLFTLLLAGFAVWYVVSRLSAPLPGAGPAVTAPPVADLPVVRPAGQTASPMHDLPPPVPVDQVPAAMPATPPVTASQGVVIETADGGDASLGDRVKDGFSLGAILFDDNMRIAVINGEMVHEGEDRGDYKVVEITARTVTIERKSGGPPVVLRMRAPQQAQ